LEELDKNKREINIIGDVHGRIESLSYVLEYSLASKIYKQIVILGDMGFKTQYDDFQQLLYRLEDKYKCDTKISVLFGNHDYYPYLRKPYSLQNFEFDSTNNIFFVRGAYSKDKSSRKEGVSWFIEEQLNENEMADVLKAYEDNKPEIVISHDCPRRISRKMFNYPFYYKDDVTGHFLDTLYSIHQPKQWIFGHHHIFKTYEGKHKKHKTLFRCISELRQYALKF
jgi:predicted phosphodiesterase